VDISTWKWLLEAVQCNIKSAEVITSILSCKQKTKIYISKMSGSIHASSREKFAYYRDMKLKGPCVHASFVNNQLPNGYQ
jgi:hypothetical protein